MAAGDRTAVFRAIGDFTRLVRDARKAKKEMGGLGDQSKKTGEDLDDAGEKAEKTEGRMGRLASTMKRARGALDRFQASDLGKWMEKSDERTKGLLKTLGGLAAKVAVLGLLGTAATASIGPVLSLVGAVAALSGAVGALPGIYLAVGAATGVLKVAFSGMEEVMKNIGKPAAEFEESIKDLPKPMQDAARQMRALRPEVEMLRKSIQARFWDGLAKPIRELGERWIPLLRDKGAQLAGTFNKMAKQAADFAMQDEVADDWSDSLGNVNKMWAGMVGAVKPVLQILTDIVAVSSEFLPDMGEGFTGAAKKAAAFIRDARETGKLKAWIREGLDQLKALGQTLVNVGRIFGAVFKAGKAEGRSFFETLRDITDKFADFLESARGQDALRKLFDSAAKAADIMLPIIQALFEVLAQVLPVLVKIGDKVGPGVEAVIRGIGDAVKVAEPYLIRLGEAIGKFLKAVGNAGPLIGSLVGGLVNVLTPVIDGLTWLIQTLTDLFNGLPQPMQQMIGSLGGATLAIGLAVLAFGKLLKVGKSVIGVAGGVAAALNKIPGVNLPTPGVAPGAPGAKKPTAPTPGPGAQLPLFDVEAGKQGDKAGKSFLSRMGAAIKKGGGAVAGAVASVFGGAAKAGGAALSGIGKMFAWATPALAGIIRGIGAAIGVLAGGIRALGVALLTNPITYIIAAIAVAAYLIITNWSTVKTWITNFWAWFTGIVSAAWNWITGIFQGAVAAISGILGPWLTLLQEIWSAAWNAITAVVQFVWDTIGTIITTAINVVRSIISGVLNAIKAVWDTVWNTIKNVVELVWNLITGNISGAIENVKNIISGVLGGIKALWDAAWGTISDVVTAVWDGITSIVGGAVDTVMDIVGGLVDFFSGVWDTIKEIFGWIGDAASAVGGFIGDAADWINPFAKGGLVGGTGNSDSEAAVLTPGEYVVPKKATAKWLPWLRAINPYDNGGLQLSMGDMLSSAAAGAPAFGMTSSSATTTAGQVSTTTGVRDVHVTQIVNNPLPEKPSETASKRTGRAARLGVMSAIGGVA